MREMREKWLRLDWIPERSLNPAEALLDLVARIPFRQPPILRLGRRLDIELQYSLLTSYLPGKGAVFLDCHDSIIFSNCTFS
jgi:hypothetical protein